MIVLEPFKALPQTTLTAVATIGIAHTAAKVAVFVSDILAANALTGSTPAAQIKVTSDFVFNPPRVPTLFKKRLEGAGPAGETDLTVRSTDLGRAC
jgi:hypothetical protein